MLLTLTTNSMKNTWGRSSKAVKKGLLELPMLAIDQLALRGLNVYASSLAGWSVEELDMLRDRADKAACPCLVLFEDSPLDFSTSSRKAADQARDRVRRLSAAANRLGCNSLAVMIKAPDEDEAFEAAATRIRDAIAAVERMELNFLIAPHDGLTNDPDRLTGLIKRIGGFRIGSLPSFAHAASLGDHIGVLRKLAPYAGAIHASINGFTKAGKHQGYDLGECVKAIRAVGFTNTLAIEYLGKKKDPMSDIEQARDILQAAIDAEDS